jgi:proton translocating ATP synthase F1 alpha subunit
MFKDTKSNLLLIDDFYNTLTLSNNEPEKTNYGIVASVKDGVATIYGLSNVAQGTFVDFFNINRLGQIKFISKGIVTSLRTNEVFVLICGNEMDIEQGTVVYSVNEVPHIKINSEILGRAIDSVGNFIDNYKTIQTDNLLLVDIKAPGIMPRESVKEPLLTGITAIDAMIPIGKGQRELIIGDRQTGKTTIALDTILNQQNILFQKDNEMVYCIYVSVGQKKSSVAHFYGSLKKFNALRYTTLVVASSSTSAVLQYLAPFTGCAIGEFFKDQGFHSLIIYDDLTKHAIAHRQMSLLVRIPPSREAYAPDVFYLHSRLLERAAKMSSVFGSGSLTALPIIETQENDVSAYIPTNVISITDGQIFLEKKLFNKGILPAINVGLSVSRVGSNAQLESTKQVAGTLKLTLAQFRALEAFLTAGGIEDLDPISRKSIIRGQILVEVLKQDKLSSMNLELILIFLYAGLNGFFDDYKPREIRRIKDFFIRILASKFYKQDVFYAFEIFKGVNPIHLDTIVSELCAIYNINNNFI